MQSRLRQARTRLDTLPMMLCRKCPNSPPYICTDLSIISEVTAVTWDLQLGRRTGRPFWAIPMSGDPTFLSHFEAQS